MLMWDSIVNVDIVVMNIRDTTVNVHSVYLHYLTYTDKLIPGFNVVTHSAF